MPRVTVNIEIVPRSQSASRFQYEPIVGGLARGDADVALASFQTLEGSLPRTICRSSSSAMP